MTTTTNVSQVKLNIMTQEQYDNATINENEFYLIPNSETIRGIAVIPVGTVFQAVWADESKDLVRQLNGQTILSSKFSGFRSWLDEVQTNYPSLFTTEVNWQAEVTNSVFGQCGKFVIDDENGTIRLPKVINAQGLMDLQYLGTIKNESLPNIKGYTNYGLFLNSANPTGCFTQTNQSVSGSSTTGIDGWRAQIFNASNVSSTYQDNAPVQQEAIQYPYYIQVATGVEETLPAIREYKVNNSDYFGKSMYSDVAPDNASWLVSNGNYNAKTVYPNYYNWLVSHIGETITANGGKVVLSTGTITDYDWVVDQNDESFRLPLLNGEEDLPGNTFGSMTYNGHDSDYTATKNGHFSLYGSGSTAYIWLHNLTSSDYSDCVGSTNPNSPCGVSIKCKKGDIIRAGYYGGTITLFGFTPAVGNCTLYYYVGDTVQDANLINAGAVLGQLSNKADIDASNFSTAGKSTIVSLLNVAYDQGSDVTASAYASSGTGWTPPKSGIIYVIGTNSNGSCSCIIYRNGTQVVSRSFNGSSMTTTNPLVIPVSPDYSYRIWQFASGQNVTFFPYKGA